MFDEEVEVLCERSIQYLQKWLDTAALVDKRRGPGMGSGYERKRDG